MTDSSQQTPSATERLFEQKKVVQDDVRELGDLAREAAAEKLGEARRQTEEYVEAKKERLHEMEDDLVEAVRRKPIKSVLVAAGVGALFGMLFLRRN